MGGVQASGDDASSVASSATGKSQRAKSLNSTDMRPVEMLRPIHKLFKTGELFGEGGVFDNHAGGNLAVTADTDISTLWISKVGT